MVESAIVYGWLIGQITEWRDIIDIILMDQNNPSLADQGFGEIDILSADIICCYVGDREVSPLLKI